MVDNRSAGFYGIGGGFNFKSGDISGTAAKTSEEKQDQGTEYFQQQRQGENDDEQNKFVDRSAQLRASLNSLAMINAVNVKRKDEDVIKKEKEKEKNKKVTLPHELLNHQDEKQDR